MIGKRLKKLREEKELTQIDLAKMLGVSQAAYQRYESGERAVPDDIKNTLADFFNVTVDYLLGRNDTPSYILAAHRKDGVEELPEEAQKQLDDYIEYLRSKYRKK